MKKVININFQGQVIAIEETAYELLKQYIESLKKYFSREEGGEEIVNDIESRIAELFGNRLKLGINCITDEDVQSIISNIGRPEDFDAEYQEMVNPEHAVSEKTHFAQGGESDAHTATEEPRTLYRNINDKIIGGVCSGLGHYFKTDPVWIRIIFVLLFSILFWVYLLLWVVLKPKVLESNVTKRLYRNPNDRFLGGVCGGIAAYFKIDSWIPRLIFAIPLMLSLIPMFTIPFFPFNRLFDDMDVNWNINFGIFLVYAVLWIIIPVASTVKQKLEMMGEEDYIKSIRETVSDNVVAVRSKTETTDGNVNYLANPTGESSKTVLGTMPPEPPRQIPPKAPYSATPTPERSGCLNALGIFVKIIFFAFVGIFGVALLGMLIGFLFAGTQLIDLKSLFINSGTENTLLWLFGILFIAVPFLAIIVWIVRRSMKAKSRPVIGIAAIILWTIGIFCGLMLTFKVAEKYKQENSVEKTVSLNPINSRTMYVEMLPHKGDYYKFTSGIGPDADIDDLPYYNEREDSLLFEEIGLDIVDSSDSLFHVRTISFSRERDQKLAKANAQQFTYNIQQQDSLLLLPEFFSTPIEQGFRVQKMMVEIAVPKGKRVEVSNELEDFQDNRVESKVRRKYRKYSYEFTDDSDEPVITEISEGTTIIKTDTII